MPEVNTTAPNDSKTELKSTSTAITKELQRQVALCRRERQDLINDWTDSVEFHRGKPFAEDSDETRIAVNKDWPRVKARVSSLFGQMPEVRLLPKQNLFAPAVPVFAKELNDTLKRADTDEAIFQALVDNTATAGIGVVMVNYQKLTDMVEVPTMDLSTIPPEQATQLLQQKLVPMEEQEVDTDTLFSVMRLSPSDLLWPTAFTGFNFDKADWIGRTGEMSWSEAKHEFKLDDSMKDKVLGEGKEALQTLKQGHVSDYTTGKQPVVEFDELFYWAYRFDPMEKYFKKIRRIVFVKGLKDPVVHEDWAGQKFNEQSGTYVGACRFPIRVLKINFVSDDAIPPSEAAIGRPQVLELIEFHTDQHNQRKRQIPARWVNTNKVDPDVLVQLMAGTWQGWIPINGRGDDAMGELGRANYPAENQYFERNVNQHLDEVWQSGANQQGSFASGERSASEARIVQQNYDMRNGLDRYHVAKFIQGIAEVMAGFLALYGEFEAFAPEDLQRLDESWDRTQIAGEFVYEVLPDSMVRLDAYQQIDMLMNILNMTAKSGFINPGPIISKIIMLAGQDPAEVVTQPNAPPSEPLNISIRSAEDLRDPIMLALLSKTGQIPGPQDLEAAKKLLDAATVPSGEMPMPEQAPADPNAPPPDAATAPGDMSVLDKVNKRSDFA